MARAFLNKLLNESERWDLKEFEKTLPPGRFLTGFEICRRYKLQPKLLPEKDLAQMELLYWKWNKAWEAKYDSMRAKTNEPFNVNDGDLRDWEVFADQNYVEELPDYSGTSMTCLAIALLPLMFRYR